MTTFIWPYDGNTVSIAGSFNDWKPEAMTHGPKGFYKNIDLSPGVHEYKFVVDGRRWCYDVLKPTVVNDSGNRNNTITIGKGGGKGVAQPQKQQQQQQQHQAAPKKVEAKSPEPRSQPEPEESNEEPPAPVPQQQGRGKGKQQQQQQAKGKQQQQGKAKGKQQQPEEVDEGQKIIDVARAQSQNLISTVKSYGVPFYVGDVDCGDSLEAVLLVAQNFSSALPEIGCMFVSGGIQQFVVAAVVPEAKAEVLSALEWVNAALSVVAGAQAQGTATLAHGKVLADPDKGVFPIKLKDLCRGPTFVLLRKRGLVKEESSDDEMYFLDE